jgi:hypothetical protein
MISYEAMRMPSWSARIRFAHWMLAPARLALALVALTLLALPLSAQQPGADPMGMMPDGPPFMTVGDTSIFAALAMPAGNVYRTGGGAPGTAYWQNKADYELTATLDTAKQTLTGSMTFRYTNNSPDTLRFIWMQMEQNAFRANSLNSLIFEQDSRFGARGFDGGYGIDKWDQLVGPRATARRVSVVRRDNGTMMKVDLAEPLAPKGVATFDIGWHFLIPEHGADRMAREGTLYEMAQWYPRVAVYDDVGGWNIEPYLGQGEFYLEYGDYTLALTVPAGFIVAATGTLQNPMEVLTATQRARLQAAATADTVVRIVTAGDFATGAARPRATGTFTWRFAAQNVRDVVWAASPEYLWDATSYKGILAHAYYRPSAASIWRDAADQARMSIMEYSERWFPYPWPQISGVEGPVSGMEYPMVAMEARGESVQDLYSVLTHEIGHMWYPMIVGSNERMYMWQDEGFNTFINTFSEARRYPAGGNQMDRAAQEREWVEQIQQRELDDPIMLQPDRVDPNLLGYLDYIKPSVGLQLLRAEILGAEAFDEGFREYTRRWAFKHPTPYDFFRTMEDVSGRRLDYFWRQWFVENARFDQAIDTVATRKMGDTLQVAVLYGNRERGVLPIRARFTFSDGTTQDFLYPAEVWSTDAAAYVRRYSFVGKDLTRIELDPESRLVDIDRANNLYRIGTGSRQQE